MAFSFHLKKNVVFISFSSVSVVSVFVCADGLVCMCRGECMCACIWKPEIDSNCSSGANHLGYFFKYIIKFSFDLF